MREERATSQKAQWRLFEPNAQVGANFFMLVLDTSVLIDLLLQIPPRAKRIEAIIREHSEFAAPFLIDAELGQVLRRFVLSNQITVERARAAFVDLKDFPLVRYVHAPLLERAFDLRDNVTFYDALYVILAETLRCPLLTADSNLNSIPAHDAQIMLIP
jgi:predicted nucleic acid-binding protein